MNFSTYILHVLGTGATAYITARHLRDPLTRPNVLAGFHLAEAGSVPLLEALSQRATAEGDTWLAEKLSRHANDERRHAQIFAQALKQHHKKLIDFPKPPAATTDGNPNENRRSPFFAAYYDGYSMANLKPDKIDWIMFMASTYILELDASKDFARMANALPEDEPRTTGLKKGLLSIAKDEEGHAAYLYEALGRRLPAAAVAEVVDTWRTRKVNALVAMVTHLTQRNGQIPSLVQDGMPVEMSDGAATTASSPELAPV